MVAVSGLGWSCSVSNDFPLILPPPSTSRAVGLTSFRVSLTHATVVDIRADLVQCQAAGRIKWDILWV